MIKSKAELLGLRPLKTDTVELEGQSVQVKELTAGQRDEINKLLISEDRDIFAINARIVVMGCDFLTDEDLPDLLDGSIDLFMPLVERISELSGMSESEGTEEAKKSLEAVPSSSSSTG